MPLMSSKPSSDPPAADLEKGQLKPAATGEEEDIGVVDPRMATCIKTTVNVVVGTYTLLLIGIMTIMVKNSHNWWGPWQSILVLLASMICTYSMAPRFKNAFVRRYATKPTPASDDCDVSTKLLP